MNKLISISKIKILYPDEWVLIGDPEEDNGELSGIVILHNKDKKKLVTKAAAQAGTIGFRKTILRFTGNLPSIGKWLKYTRLI